MSPQLAASKIAMPTSKWALKAIKPLAYQVFPLRTRQPILQHLSIGRMAVPFGQFIDSQTSHSSVNSSFIINDLGYVFIVQHKHSLQWWAA